MSERERLAALREALDNVCQLLERDDVEDEEWIEAFGKEIPILVDATYRFIEVVAPGPSSRGPTNDRGRPTREEVGDILTGARTGKGHLWELYRQFGPNERRGLNPVSWDEFRAGVEGFIVGTVEILGAEIRALHEECEFWRARAGDP